MTETTDPLAKAQRRGDIWKAKAIEMEADRDRADKALAQAEQRADAMTRAMESTAADALAHRGCHRDLMGQCLRAERAEAAIERVRSVLESEAVVGRSALDYRGLITSVLMADEAQQPETQAQPPYHRWYVETRDGVADQWAPGTRFTDRAEAAERYEHVTANWPTWKDGTPVERRLVQETTSYTVLATHGVPHIGGNAEDCPACSGTNPDYPFICPGPNPTA